MKTLLKVILFLALLALPFGIKYALLYDVSAENYQASDLEQESEQVITEPSEPTYQSHVDQPALTSGLVLIDSAHRNNLMVDDLTPLVNRLAARGISVEYYEGENSLSWELRPAKAFVVMAPTYSFYSEELKAVQDFVASGGRLLLVADPTRSVPDNTPPGYIDLETLFFPQSAIPAINSLARPFGIQFFEDYLYNLTDYETNYRNIKIDDFETNPLTEGMWQVVVYATHSIETDGTALMIGDANTQSNLRTGENHLVVAGLSTDKNVLALGDLTFLTAPYHRAANNDRFLSNLADWLAAAPRQWLLSDFPYIFHQPVDLVPISGDNFDPAVFNLVSPLQQLFDRSGLTLNMVSADQNVSGHDKIMVGLFSESDVISGDLARMGITIYQDDSASDEETTPVTKVDDQRTLSGKPSSGGGYTPTPSPYPTLDTGDSYNNDSVLGTPIPTFEVKEKPVITLTVEGLGTFNTEGLQLFVVKQGANQTSLTILTENRNYLSRAVYRLINRDFSGCFSQDGLTLCSADSSAVWLDSQERSRGTMETTTGSGVFILSVDNYNGPGRSSIDEWQAALDSFADYDVKIWSVKYDGIPTEDDIRGFSAFIIDIGDFAYEQEVLEEMPVELLDGANWFLIGEQPGDPDYEETGQLVDLVVNEPSHRLAIGLPDDAVIDLSPTESGVSSILITDYDELPEGVYNVLQRGPSSEFAGFPALQVYEFPDSESRFALASFAFYRLPEDLQPIFAKNVVDWLLAP